MKIKTTAPGKLILLGEYAVLEGVPALVMAVNRFAEVTLETISSEQCRVSAPAIGVSDLPFIMGAGGKVTFGKELSNQMLKRLSFFVTALETVLSSASLPLFTITLDTSQFFTPEKQKLGLGSSAALTVALLSALRKLEANNFDIKKKYDAMLATSLKIHRKAQNNVGSGIDIAASIFGGVLKYQIADIDFKILPIYEKLTIPDELYILFIWTGKSASTAQFVRRVSQFRMDRPNVYGVIVERMKQISLAGIEAIQTCSRREFLKSVRLYYNEMKNLGDESGLPIVSKSHQYIHDLIVEEGGAYKPSGAGGGDLGTAFCNSRKMKEKFEQKLSKNGIKIINLEPANKGIQVSTF